MLAVKIIRIVLCAIIGIPITLVFLWLGSIVFMTVKYPTPSCTNSNPVFENTPSDSKASKTELIRLLKETGDEKAKFWCSKYIDPDHIEVRIQNDKILCKKIHYG
jgi:hypothetical protein